MKLIITGGLGHIGSGILENIHLFKNIKGITIIDNISSNIPEKSFNEDEKTEPVISENAVHIEKTENLKTIESNEETEPEFNAKNDELDDEFNQETEEELLDIPTFLRRQAN